MGVSTFGAASLDSVAGAVDTLTAESLPSGSAAAPALAEGASLVGIDLTRVSLLTFAISGALAAVAAVLFAPINLVSPGMGNLVILKAFVIIILGGMGSVPGAILGGMIIGFAESFGAFYISTDLKDIMAFALLVVILSVRPQGLFPAPAR